MMVRIVSIGSKRSVTLTSCGIGMVAPLSSSILRISKWFLEDYDCLFCGLGGWQLVIDNVTKEVKMIKMTCGRRGWEEWCPPWSWQWSRPCSPRSKAATTFLFILVLLPCVLFGFIWKDWGPWGWVAGLIGPYKILALHILTWTSVPEYCELTCPSICVSSSCFSRYSAPSTYSSLSGIFQPKILRRNLSAWLQQAAHLWVGSPSEPACLHISGVRPSLMERG